MRAIASYAVVILPICFVGDLDGQGVQDDSKKFVRGFLQQLHSANPKTRQEALDNLEVIAYSIRGSTSSLIFKLENDPDSQVRIKVARVISAIGPSAILTSPHLISSLTKMVDDPDDEVKAAIVGTLAATAPFSKSALHKIIPLINYRKSVAVQRSAIGYVRAIGPEAKEALPALIKALDDPDKGIPGNKPSIRETVVLAIPYLGTEAKEAARALQKILETGDDQLKGMTLGTLAKIMPKDPKLVPLLVDALKNKEHKSLRFSAALALGSLGHDANGAIPDLIATLKAGDVEDRKLDLKIKGAALLALGEIGPSAKDAIPTIQALLAQFDDELLRLQGELALKRIRGAKGE